MTCNMYHKAKILVYKKKKTNKPNYLFQQTKNITLNIKQKEKVES